MERNRSRKKEKNRKKEKKKMERLGEAHTERKINKDGEK